MIEILTAILVAITAAYAYFTYKMLLVSRSSVKMMQQQLQETVRPYVSFDLIPCGALIEIHLKNSGATPALKVLATVTPTVFATIRSTRRKSRLSGNPIAFLAPGRELREFLGSWAEVKEMSETMKFEVNLNYSDSSDNEYFDVYHIDLGGLDEMPYLGRPDIAEELKKIAASLKIIEKK